MAGLREDPELIVIITFSSRFRQLTGHYNSALGSVELASHEEQYYKGNGAEEQNKVASA